jgi:CO/xanthine dehydrogenase Mo-binding subunit
MYVCVRMLMSKATYHATGIRVRDLPIRIEKLMANQA